MRSRVFLAIVFFIVAGIVFYVGAQLSNGDSFMSRVAQPEDIVTDSLSIAGVSQLISEGVCDVEIFKSDREMVVVSYDAVHCTNNSKVKGEKLNSHFRVDQVGFFDFTIRPDVKIEIYTESLDSLINRGTGHITSNDTFVLDRLYLQNEGVGSIQYTTISNSVVAENRGVGSMDLYGRTETLNVVNEGIGSVSAENLMANKVRARNSGVGSLNVHGLDSLSITNDGIGSLRYGGPGEVYYERNDGIGSIKKN
jgi:hypothetical protein